MHQRVLPKVNACQDPIADDERDQQQSERQPKVAHPSLPAKQDVEQPHGTQGAGDSEVPPVSERDGQAQAKDEHGKADGAVCQSNGRLGDVLLHASVREDAGIRHRDEEQPFFQLYFYLITNFF